MKFFPQHLRDAGYFTTNARKEDFNLETPGKLWDVPNDANRPWRSGRKASPSSSMINIQTCHESQIRKRPHELVHDPAKVRIPAYHPDTPEVRRDWAQYYDKVTEMDAEVGAILARLEADGLKDEYDRLLLRRPRQRHAARTTLALRQRTARAARHSHPRQVQEPAPRRLHSRRSDGPARRLRRFRADDPQSRGIEAAAELSRATAFLRRACRDRERVPARLSRPDGRTHRPGAERDRRALRLCAALHAAPHLRPARRLHVPNADDAGLEEDCSTPENSTRLNRSSGKRSRPKSSSTSRPTPTR